MYFFWYHNLFLSYVDFITYLISKIEFIRSQMRIQFDVKYPKSNNENKNFAMWKDFFIRKRKTSFTKNVGYIICLLTLSKSKDGGRFPINKKNVAFLNMLCCRMTSTIRPGGNFFSYKLLEKEGWTRNNAVTSQSTCNFFILLKKFVHKTQV